MRLCSTNTVRSSLREPLTIGEIFQLLLEASMSSYSADYNNLNMTRQKDKRLGTEYIIINNRLIDGNFVYMKTPLESIKESVSISNRFLQ